jgi:hypothetical protein
MEMKFPMKILVFEPRFVPERLLVELSNLWHLSRVPTSTTGGHRYDRLVWTAAEFVKEHPELNLSTTAVYKDLDAMTTFGMDGR